MNSIEKVKRELEIDVVQLYESVAVMEITPYQAKEAFMKLIEQALLKAKEEGKKEAVKEMKRVIGDPMSTVFNVGRNDWETEDWKKFAIEVLTQTILTHSKGKKYES